MLKKIGTMKISRKTSSLVNAWIKADDVERKIATNGRDVQEIDDERLQFIGLGGLPKEISLPEYNKGDAMFLAFRSVEKHNDDWQLTRYKRRDVPPAFWHVVLKGRATIHTWSSKIKVKKGDIFVMDPNIDHEVTSSSFCTTLVTTVPKVLYTKVPAI
jgi:hypothetical protein